MKMLDEKIYTITDLNKLADAMWLGYELLYQLKEGRLGMDCTRENILNSDRAFQNLYDTKLKKLEPFMCIGITSVDTLVNEIYDIVRD